MEYRLTGWFADFQRVERLLDLSGCNKRFKMVTGGNISIGVDWLGKVEFDTGTSAFLCGSQTVI